MLHLAKHLEPIDSPPVSEAGPRIQVAPYKLLLGMSCALAILVLAAFWGLYRADFLLLDDDEYVTENSFVTTGLTATNIQWAFLNSHSGHWHPLTWVSHMLDCELFGLNPAAHHLVNVLLHTCSIVLLFFALRRFTGAQWESFFISALIGVSPLRLESVAWIAERKDVLSMFFFTSMLLGYSYYVRKPSLLRYASFSVPFVLGLLSKPTLVTAPLLLLLLDFWPLRRIDLRSFRAARGILLEKVPLLVCALCVSALALWGQSNAGALQSLASTPLSDRIANSAIGYLVYLGKVLWPFNLGAFYPLRPYPSGLAAGAALGLLSLSVWALRNVKVRPYLVFGLMWFLVALLPVIGLVQVGAQQVADRWTYLPHIGLLVALVFYARDFSRELEIPRAATVFGCVVLSVWFVETRLHISDWLSSESLFTQTIRVAPENFFAHTNIGVAFDRQGKMDVAAFHYGEAVRLNPTYPTALNDLGSIRARQGDLSSAEQLFRRALAVAPNFLPARYHLGLVREMTGDHFLAAAEWVSILQQDPSYDRARKSLEFVTNQSFLAGCDTLQATRRSDLSENAQILRSRLSEWSAGVNDLALRESLLKAASCFP